MVAHNQLRGTNVHATALRLQPSDVIKDLHATRTASDASVGARARLYGSQRGLASKTPCPTGIYSCSKLMDTASMYADVHNPDDGTHFRPIHASPDSLYEGFGATDYW